MATPRNVGRCGDPTWDTSDCGGRVCDQLVKNRVDPRQAIQSNLMFYVGVLDKVLCRDNRQSIRPTLVVVNRFILYHGPIEPFNPVILSQKGSLFLTRPTLVDYTATRDELLRRAGDVLGWIQSGDLNLRIDRTLPLSQAAEAHRLLESRQTKGKVLLIP